MTLAIRWRPSPNCNARRGDGAIRHLILHYTGMVSAAAAEDRLCDPAAEVSAHYLVHEDGAIVQLVAESARAWHAGRSWWRGAHDLNSSSIGIEISNPGHDWGYRPFPEVQMQAVVALVGEIVGRHHIAPACVLGHSDIAPTRKADPGELFPWQRLAARGLALAAPAVLPSDPGWSEGEFATRLHQFGYEVSDLRAATIAFQRHFRPANVDGRIDAETRATLRALPPR